MNESHNNTLNENVASTSITHLLCCCTSSVTLSDIDKNPWETYLYNIPLYRVFKIQLPMVFAYT